MGSFEAWSRLVRESLVWLGRADPADSQVAVREIADTTHGPLGDMLVGLVAMFGGDAFTVSELVNNLDNGHNGRGLKHERQELERALEELCNRKDGRWSTKGMGRIFAGYAGRIVGGHRLVRDQERGRRGIRWMVAKVTMVKVA